MKERVENLAKNFLHGKKLIKNLKKKASKTTQKPRKPSSPQAKKPVEGTWFNLIKLFISFHFHAWLVG